MRQSPSVSSSLVIQVGPGNLARRPSPTRASSRKARWVSVVDDEDIVDPRRPMWETAAPFCRSCEPRRCTTAVPTENACPPWESVIRTTIENRPVPAISVGPRDGEDTAPLVGDDPGRRLRPVSPDDLAVKSPLARFGVGTVKVATSPLNFRFRVGFRANAVTCGSVTAWESESGWASESAWASAWAWAWASVSASPSS